MANTFGPGLSMLTPNREKFYPAITVDALLNFTKYRGARDRRLPLVVDSIIGDTTTRMFVVLEPAELELVDKDAVIQNELVAFRKKFNLFDKKQWMKTLLVRQKEFDILAHELIPCCICRDGAIRVFGGAVRTRINPLNPFLLDDNGEGYILRSKCMTADFLYRLFNRKSTRLSAILESFEARAGRRCHAHARDVQRGCSAESVKEVWYDAGAKYQDLVRCIDSCQLLEMVKFNVKEQNYCTCCTDTVVKAFHLLVGHVQVADLSDKEKLEYSPEIFDGLRFDEEEEDIYFDPSEELFLKLVSVGASKYQEGRGAASHAKTIDVGQHEVVACIGMVLLEYMENLQISFRSEMRIYDVVIGILAVLLKRKFGIAVEEKMGMSQSDLLCKELQQEEASRAKKKQAKKDKRQRQKERRLTEANPNQETVEATDTPDADEGANGDEGEVTLSNDANDNKNEKSDGIEVVQPCANNGQVLADSQEDELKSIFGISWELRRKLNKELGHPDSCNDCWPSFQKPIVLGGDGDYSTGNSSPILPYTGWYPGCKSMMELMAEAEMNDGLLLPIPREEIDRWEEYNGLMKKLQDQTKMKPKLLAKRTDTIDRINQLAIPSEGTHSVYPFAVFEAVPEKKQEEVKEEPAPENAGNDENTSPEEAEAVVNEQPGPSQAVGQRRPPPASPRRAGKVR